MACGQPRESPPQRATTKDGRTLATVQWADGVRHGKARIHLSDGGTKEGVFKSGSKEGIWVHRGPGGDTIGSAEYAAGKLHGRLVERSGEVVIREARYVHGVADGPRVVRYADGHPGSLVWFMNGREHGPAWFWNRRDTVNIGKLGKGQYEHGVVVGTWFRHYGDSVLCNENNYVNGARHGIWTQYARDGSILRQVEYRNDRLARTIVDRMKKN